MTAPRNLAWTANSTASNLTYIEVIFQLSPKFFTKPGNRKQTRAFPLPMLPSTDRRSGEYTSVEALEHVDELTSHYRSVLCLAAEHKLAYKDYFYHFWLRLRLRSEEAEIEFEGYDSWLQMRTLFTWLEQTANQSSVQETADGWQLLIACLDERFHFRESGVDPDSRTTSLSFPRSDLLARLPPLRGRVDQIISRLVDEIGEDYWTDFRRDLA